MMTGVYGVSNALHENRELAQPSVTVEVSGSGYQFVE